MLPHTVPCFGSVMENPAHRGVHFSGIRQTEKIPLDVTKKEWCEGGGNPTAASRDRRWWHGVGGMQLNTQCSIHGAPRGTGAIPGLDVNRGPLSTSPDSCRTACRKDSPRLPSPCLAQSALEHVFFPLSFCFYRFHFGFDSNKFTDRLLHFNSMAFLSCGRHISKYHIYQKDCAKTRARITLLMVPPISTRQ